jgi:hypothetical protein
MGFSGRVRNPGERLFRPGPPIHAVHQPPVTEAAIAHSANLQANEDFREILKHDVFMFRQAQDEFIVGRRCEVRPKQPNS